MNKFSWKAGKLWRRVLPLLLAFCLLSTMIFPAIAKAVIINTEGDPSVYGGDVVYTYRWTRVMNVKDLKKLLTKSMERKYCMIVYDDDNCCPNGFNGYGKIAMDGNGEETDFGGEIDPWYCSGNEFIDFDDKNGVFFTPDLPGFVWQIALTGGTSGSGGMPYVRLYHTYNNALFRIGGTGFAQNEGFVVGPDANNGYLNLDKDWYYTRVDVEKMFTNPEWTIFGSDTTKEYTTPNGYFRFVKEVSGSNWQLAFNEDDDEWTVISNNDPAEDAGILTDYEGRFKLFIGEKVAVPAIKTDMTIPCGTTFTVDNGVILCDKVTLTIEPGAVLTVKGVLYNNGCVYNNGTVIVDGDGVINYFNPDKNSLAGRIVCEGGVVEGSKFKTDGAGSMFGDGNLIVMEGGRIDFHEGDVTQTNYGTLEITYGGSCINYGTINMPRGLYSYDGYFDNRGTVITGKKISSSASAKDKEYYKNHYLSYISSFGYSIINNSKTWDNYCEKNVDRDSKIINISG